MSLKKVNYIYKFQLSSKNILYFKNKQVALKCALQYFFNHFIFPKFKVCTSRITEKTRRLYYYEIRCNSFRKEIKETEEKILIKIYGSDLIRLYVKEHQSLRKKYWSSYKKEIIEKQNILGEINLTTLILEKIELNDNNWKEYLGVE